MIKAHHSKGLKGYIKENKSTFVIYVILRTLVLVALAVSLIRGDFESAFVCALSLVLFILPAFVEKNFGINIPSTLEIIILLFIFAAEILGELACYYIRFPYWDAILHTLNGFLCAAIGFSLVDIFNRNDKFKFQLSPLFLSIVAFCFSMTIGVLWEFFEYFSDLFLGTDMQKDFIINNISTVALDPTKTNTCVIISNITDTVVNGESLGINGYLDIGLIDTMKDLLVNFVGAVVFSIIGFFYIKSRGKNKFAKRFIPTIREKENLDDTKDQ